MMPETCRVFFPSSACSLQGAADSFDEYGFDVERTQESLIAGRPGTPCFVVTLVVGEEVLEHARKIGEGTAHAQSMASCNACFEILIEDLDEALDEINTLMEVQGALQDASGGFLYLPWNGNLCEPWTG